MCIVPKIEIHHSIFKLDNKAQYPICDESIVVAFCPENSHIVLYNSCEHGTTTQIGQLFEVFSCQMT